MTSKEVSQKAILDFLQRQAEEALSRQGADREEYLAMIKGVFAEMAQEGAAPAGAPKQFDEWIRALMKMMEASGGAKGGTA
jgi:hypothetical protein